MANVLSEDSDETAHLFSLILVFDECFQRSKVSSNMNVYILAKNSMNVINAIKGFH